MKTKVFFLLVAVLTLWSCSEDDPPPLLLRAVNADFFFDATSTSAVQNPDGTYTITGTGDRGKITIILNDIALGYKQFNGDGIVIYESANGVVYTTLSNPNASFTGSMVMETTGATISGRFKFTGYNGQNPLEFRQGEFNNIAVGAPDPSDSED
ncbi:DUF6252 family protein [Aureitalea marina]|nr:DUF6252 family protein [Aureitalea marina]